MRTELVSIMQTAIGPVILISGVGLLLLTFTNRLGRTIDRVRSLSGGEISGRGVLAAQLKILWSRARILRASIMAASMSALLSALLVITVFLSAWLKAETGIEIVAFFIGSLVSLIVALFYFLKDVNKSLEALKLDLLERTEIHMTKENGVILFVNRFEDCVAFYRDGIGLDVGMQKPGIVRFSMGPMYLQIEDAAFFGAQKSESVILRHHAASISEQSRLLSQRGLTLEVHDLPWGEIGILYDPSGNKFEYFREK